MTLSYCIEPGTGEVGWKDRYRYPSSLLRFDVRSALETEQLFKSRINIVIQNEETDAYENGSPIQWVIGQNNRNRGSAHSECWVGNAADSAGSNIIGVFLASGWWKTSKHLRNASSTVRYSLVVSLSTLSEQIDLYTPIVMNIRVPIEIPASELEIARTFPADLIEINS